MAEVKPASSGEHGVCVSPHLLKRTTAFPDEHAKIAEMNWCTQYVQLMPGVFEGSLFDTECVGVTIGLEDYNLPMEEMFTAPPGTFFYIRARTGGEAICEGQSLNCDFGMICTDEALLHFLTKGAYSGFYIAIDHTVVDKLTSDFDWRNYLRRTKWWRRTEGQEARTLDAMVERFLSSLSHDNDRASLPSLGEDIALAAGNLISSFGDAKRASPLADTRTYVFRKARDYILDRINEDISIAEICEELRVSQRTLEYSFNDVVSLSPKRYILTQKLNRVRSDIVGTRGLAEVIDLSYKWGFNHPSRFAQQYKRHFLELPSETKRRVSPS